MQFLSHASVIHPLKYEEGMGGSENSLHQLSRHLARRGHAVRVVANLGGRPAGVYDGVTYAEQPVDACDALVYFRGSYPAARHISARRRVWFTTDAYLDGDNWAATLWPHVDSGVCLSQFHLGDLQKRYGHHLPPLAVIPLGCDPGEIIETPKVRNRLIYCSEPARGLEHLLRGWPGIRQAHPDATLHVTFDYRLWNSHPGVEAYRHIAAQPGIEYLGMVPRRRLLQAQAEAELHAYPCTFDENFCLASLECQMQGTPSVTTRAGALPETVKYGSGWCCQVQHVPQVVADILRDRESLHRHSQQAREHALERTWAHTAAAWDAFIA